MKIAAVNLPRRLRGFETEAPPEQAFDVTLDGDRVASIRPVAGPAQGTLLSGLVDAHAHIDKNYTVHEVGAVQGDLFAAIARMAEHRARWSGPALRERMARALDDAWRCGTRALRTHLDWGGPATPLSLAVLLALREEWRGRVELQFVSLTPLDVFDDAVAGEAIAHAVAQANTEAPGRPGVLGAFVYRNEEIERKLRRVFELAKTHGLALDFHVDEGLDRDATGLNRIAELTLEHGWQGRVTCGHACSLSVQHNPEALHTLSRCAAAGLHLVALPTTNLYLQGAWDRTPVERGITRLREAAEHGLRPSIATDNVADGFYPYGSYDLLETFQLGVQVAHLAPAMDWLDSITASPARALGLAWDGRLREGCPADLVLLAARNEYELLTPAGRRRTVIRHGQTL
ncbi:amidohydrolase family protein [Variovorax terrae]|uniref:Amidohydrolase family protein n=1 Tax=Variovorax terrae TaxID=2923278 RepID=A0A9X2AP47_9BURK|nr:amidohydrolase family protein [Variovorax terrae]MCJ0761661.1 amidohydrolase family protein [Variovorax terrae]